MKINKNYTLNQSSKEVYKSSVKKKVLVVGCGFAGSVYARQIAENGHKVICIDRRSHIAGNAYDYLDSNGIRVHKYGPHLLHTSNSDVFEWLAQYSEFIPYEHRVVALLESGQKVPFPLNRKTLEIIFERKFASEELIKSFLESISESLVNPKNSAETLYCKIGRELTDIFFRRYTEKMWDLKLEEMHPSVMNRVPIRYDYEDRYFPNDRFQVLPKLGYTLLIGNILNHENINVFLDTQFSKDMLREFDYSFNSMAIDEYYGFVYGELPYRSIRFHEKSYGRNQVDSCAIINYTDTSPYTRETRWHNLPGHDSGSDLVSVTVEEPCDYKQNSMERYYPVKTAEKKFEAIYKKYQMLASEEKKQAFIGRCGTYQYLDMHQVVNQSLIGSRKWIQKYG